MEKHDWEKPELIVLVRGKDEENVLTACKYNGVGYPPGSSHNDKNYCQLMFPVCSDCAVYAVS